MATSQVSICNLALHRLGQERITSISDDNKRAILLNDIYENCLRLALEMGLWNFAFKRATLTNTGAAPTTFDEYAYQFTKPSDCIWVWREYNGEEFKDEGVLLSGAETLDIIYIYYNTDPTTYSASFVELLSLILADKAAYSITQDKELTAQINEEMKMARDEALFNMAKATRREDFKINTFTSSRY